MSNALFGGDDVETALFLAVLYHGLSSLHEKAIPARADTVVKTADMFDDYLKSKREDRRSRPNRAV